MQTERVKAMKVVSICILLSMGSVSAWGGEKTSSSGEIVIKNVGMNKIITMQGKIKPCPKNKNVGLIGPLKHACGGVSAGQSVYFAVPGKKIDIKCKLYPCGLPDNPYNNMSGIPILSNNKRIYSEVGKFETYRFSLTCPMAGPFITDIKSIGEYTQH